MARTSRSLMSVLTALTQLESVHLSTWNLLGVDPTGEALGAFPKHTSGLRQGSYQQPQALPPSGLDNICRQQQLQHSVYNLQQQEQTQAGPSGTSVQSASGSCRSRRGHGSAGEAVMEFEPEATAAEGVSPDSGSGSGSGIGSCRSGAVSATTMVGAAASRLGHHQAVPCLPPLSTWAWRGLKSLSLTHWPCVYGKLREAGPPQPGRCYTVCWDDLPRWVPF